MKTSEITAKLADRYSNPEWVFVTEVPNSTGAKKSRICDAISMCIWPSKGLHLYGHEVKASRADWLREMQDVSKAEAFARFCHYWWIVAPVGVVKLEELPETWGLIQVGSGGSRVKKPASIREPEPVSYGFLASLLRRAIAGDSQRAAIAYSRGFSDGKSSVSGKDWEKQQLKARVAELEAVVGDLERMRKRLKTGKTELDWVRQYAERSAGSLEELAAMMDQFKKGLAEFES